MNSSVGEQQTTMEPVVSSLAANNVMSRSENGSNRGTDSMVSHTESGYMTDSVNSSSVSGRDKESLLEPCLSNNSESDITPCGENLMTFSDSSGSVSLQSTSEDGAGPATPHIVSPVSDADSQVLDSVPRVSDSIPRVPDSIPRVSDSNIPTGNGCTNNVLDGHDRITQLQHITNLDLHVHDVSKEISSIDNIFTSNFATVRPENLSVKNRKTENSVFRTRSHSGEEYSLEQEKHPVNSEIRKRSKSSAFPISKQKEGVNITEEMLSKSLPHGKLSRGNSGLIEFIADDLQEKIRRSSPMSKTASEVSSSRRSSDLSITSVESMASSSMATSLASGMSRSYPQSPDCIPPIDPIAIHEIENQARHMAENIDHMMATIRNNLHQMSAIGVGCEEAYKTSVDVTCDSVDASIKSMYAMMAKCEELTQTMQPVYKLADQIKDIKRLLDRFESQLGDKP